MTEPEITETEVTEEHVENPAAVLKKNRELLADLAKMKDRAASLEDLARDLGLDDAALADPKAHVAKRADDRKAADARTARVREAALVKIAAERRIVRGDLEELLSRVTSDPGVTIEKDGKVTGLDAALGKLAARPAAPGPPSPSPMNWHDSIHHKPAVSSYEELQKQGPEAVAKFAETRPERYAALRADFERRLAKPERRA